MNFTEFRASRAFKGTFDDVIGVSKDLEKSMGSKFTAEAFGDVINKDTTMKTRLRSALAAFTEQSAKNGLPANIAKNNFIRDFVSELPAAKRDANSLENFSKELRSIVTDSAETNPLAAVHRATRVAQPPKGVINDLLRDQKKLADIGGPAVTQVLRNYETGLDGIMKRVKESGIKELSDQERLTMRSANSAFVKESKESGRGITGAQARENFLDALGLEKGSRDRQQMADLLAKPASETKPKAQAVRQEPTMIEPAPVPKKSEVEATTAAAEKKVYTLEETRNDVSRIGTDLNRLRLKGKLSEEDTKRAAELLQELRNDVSKRPNFKELGDFPEAGKKFPRLSPVATLNSLEAGLPVTESSLKNLDNYFAKNHLTKPATNAFVSNAKAFAQLISGPVTAPFRLLNVVGDAYSPIALRAGTVSALALSVGYAGLNVNYLAHPELGMHLGNTVPYTYALEPFDQIGKGDGYKDLSAEADFAIRAANWSPEFKKQLMDAAKAYSEAGIDTSQMTPAEKAAHFEKLKQHDPKLANVTAEQLEAGVFFLEQIAKPTASLAANNSATAQNAAAARGATAQEALNTTDAVRDPINFGSSETTEPAYSEYQVDGESFNNRLKGVTYNNTALYNDLAKAFKDATKMDIKPEQELTAANKLTKGEAALFAEEAKRILAEHKVDTEKAEQKVQFLIEPSAPELHPGR